LGDGRRLRRNGRHAIAVNWGIAAVVYLFVGGLIARLLGRTHRYRPLGRQSPTHDQEDS
jgi:hypothetical protein